MHSSISTSSVDDFPPVTIIMPIRNEASYIARSLQSVLTQDYPLDRLEVCIVDGMSTDETREIIQQTIDQVQLSGVGVMAHTVILDNPNHTAPAALNIGLRHGSGKIIIRVDGHCEIAPNYVSRCVAALRETSADCVGGPMVTVGKSPMAQAIALAQSSPFGVGGVAFRTGRSRPGSVDTVAFGAYRREVFDRIGGFDEELVRNQDDEFNFRLTQAGGVIWLDPSIRSIYHSRAELLGLWRQYYQYGLYKVRVIQKRGAISSWRHIVPALFVIGLTTSFLLRLLTGRRFWSLTIAGPYGVSNGLAAFWTARRNWWALPMLPLIFLVLHVAYGLGFLTGLWYWISKSEGRGWHVNRI